LYSPTQLIGTYIILFIFGALLSVTAKTIAIYLDDHDQYAAANAMISMPLFFTSSAMMPMMLYRPGCSPSQGSIP